LDLTDDVWPVCLLKFKSELDHVAAGCFFEVVVADPDVVQSVVSILQHYGGRIIRIDKARGRYHLLICRGISAQHTDP
jgi:TusA-related sulfurtransferase